ncbi:MAG: radical SAM protein [Deltaproteobacteria bacterium]|nr:radical SAM protein [Deltaproteobacteria bacterium]
MKMGLRSYARVAQGFLTRKVPVYAHYGITHRCNLTCKMCGIWRYGNRKEELELPQIQMMAERMRRLGVVQLSIGGGEPFACDYLEEAAKCFADQGLNTRVLTNGVGVSEARLRKCVDYGVTSFSISLDSLYPARFDYICEKEGSWEEAVRSMTTIGQLVKGTKGLPSINCVVSNLNLEELPSMVEFAATIGFHISFLPIELLADPKDGVRNWEGRFVRYRPEMGVNVADSPEVVQDRIDRAYEKLLSMKKAGWPILNSTPYLEASRMYLKTGRFPAEGCDAGRLYFSVSPNGQFAICHRTLHQHKSFLDPDFEAYFHSAAYERKRLLEAGSCEGCMRACWIDNSFMFRTIEGFFEASTMALKQRVTDPAPWDEARKWAKYDQVEIVPHVAK